MAKVTRITPPEQRQQTIDVKLTLQQLYCINSVLDVAITGTFDSTWQAELTALQRKISGAMRRFRTAQNKAGANHA